MAKAKPQKYTGDVFKRTVYAEIEFAGMEGEQDYASYNDGPLKDNLAVDGESKWIATYKLVSVRRLRRTSRIVRGIGG